MAFQNKIEKDYLDVINSYLKAVPNSKLTVEDFDKVFNKIVERQRNNYSYSFERDDSYCIDEYLEFLKKEEYIKSSETSKDSWDDEWGNIVPQNFKQSPSNPEKILQNTGKTLKMIAERHVRVNDPSIKMSAEEEAQAYIDAFTDREALISFITRLILAKSGSEKQFLEVCKELTEGINVER